MSDPMKKKWSGEDDGEVWTLVIEPDCFDVTTPMTVAVDAKYHDGTDDHRALAWATPEQAREMAAALTFFADYVESANANPKNIG